jgi:hypothetical protein
MRIVRLRRGLRAGLDYELTLTIDSFALSLGVKSKMLGRVADAFRHLNIRFGPPLMDVRIVQRGYRAATADPPNAAPSQPRASL